jgi:hypothetical protein
MAAAPPAPRAPLTNADRERAASSTPPRTVRRASPCWRFPDPPVAAHALSPADAPMGLRIARNVDLVVLALAVPLFLATGISFAGWAIGAGAWVIQRAVKVAATRRARASDDPRTTVGLMAGSMIVRGWIVAGIIFGVGIATSDEAGLSGALLFIATFTIWFTASLIARPLEEEGRR